MIKKDVNIHTEYIKLSDLLKFSGVVSQGSDAKYLILENAVKVNGETASQRGRKIYPGMKVNCAFMGDEYEINVNGQD